MKIAIYSIADDNYISYAVVALKSVQRFHAYDLFVISGELSEKSKDLLKTHNIEYVYTDKHDVFPHYKDWPNITFVHLFGPEIFYNMGYDYSLMIAADALCVRPLNMEEVFCATDGYAGIENGGPRSDNFLKKKYVQNKYGLSCDDMLSHSTNTGLVFWNNNAMKDYELGRKCTEAWEEDVFIAADQSLFALVSISLPFKTLSREYNFRLGNKDVVYEDDGNVRVFHYTGLKPWNNKPLHRAEWIEFRNSIL